MRFGPSAGASTGIALALLLSAQPAATAQRVAASAPRITAADCEQLSPTTYRIVYELTPGARAVQIYLSASPERIETSRPALTATASPVTVSVPDRPGRVYFHLKSDPGPTRVVAARRLPLEGAVNFRDLGGYQTTDGRFVKWGLVYRTDHLAGLTARDYGFLDRLGIRLVCDLRTPGERQRAPTKWQGHEPDVLLAPILSDAQLPATPVPLPRDEFMRRFELIRNGKSLNLTISTTYRQFVTEYVESYRQVFRRLVAGELPSVTNCTAGQDRTGVYSAILLTALGIPRETVVADYLLTTRYRLTDAVVEERQKDWIERYGVEATPGQVRAIQGLRAETLHATFDVIDATYGSFDTFRRDVLKVSDADLTALRARLLER